jgi:hypothetical protein
MKFFIRTAGTPFLTTKRMKNLLEELKEEPVDHRVRRYKSNWLRYVTRINNKMPKITQNDRPHGRGRLGRPLNRLLDEAKTGLSRPN